MNEGLRALLGDRFDAGTRLATPQDERELMEAFRILRTHGGVLGREVTISRARLQRIGHIDVKSGVVQAGAGVTLMELEEALRLKDLSLGPISPSMQPLTVSDWLEGPWAGLRAMPGGRLETACLALDALMPDGLRFSSRPSPRSAAGPDLDQLFLGGEGRFGLLLSATLRVFNRPRAGSEVQYAFDEVGALLEGVRRSLAAGVWYDRLVLAHDGGRWTVWGKVIGSADGVERDLVSAGDAFNAAGGKPMKPSPEPVALPENAHEERELSWEDLAAELHARHVEKLNEGAPGVVALTLWRAGLESALVEGATERGLPMRRAPWTRQTAETTPLLQALAEADPNGVMGERP